MLRFLFCAALLLASLAARASPTGEIDWQRRVIKARGQGAPDLNAPSIAVARLGAERAAKADALRNLLETLDGMQVSSGSNVGAVLQGDGALKTRTEGTVRGFRVLQPHYFSDGGVALDVELDLDKLPPELLKLLKPPRSAPGASKSTDSPSPKGEASPAQPAPSKDAASVEAQGEAAILAGDKPAARAKAIEDALRHAVEMTAGTQVVSVTAVKDFQTKMDEVLTRSAGFVRSYQILKEGVDGDVVQVTVRAQIGLAALDKDLAAMGLLMVRKNQPRTMVLIAEQNIGMAAPAAAWMKGQGESALVSTDLRIAESVVLDGLRQDGFGQLIDPEIASTKAASVGGITSQITAAQARKLGTLTTAEVIIIGQVLAQSRGPLADLGPGWRSCVATLSARAVSTDDGDILATSESTQSAAQLDDLSCGNEAIKKASRAFTADIVKKLGERWSSDVSSGNAVHVTVKGVDSLRLASEFRGALSQYIRGVTFVNQRSFGGGTQQLDVQLVGSTEDFASELEAKKLGKFSVKVRGVTANTVDVELGKE